MRRLPAPMLLVLTALVACAGPSETDAADGPDMAAASQEAAAEQSLRARFDEFIAAFNREDVATIEGFYGDNVTLIPPDEPVITDRAAVIANLGSLTTGDYEIEAEIRDLQMGGDLAITLVAYTDTFTPSGASDLEAGSSEGRWAIVWNRGADGTWRISREIWNLAPEETPES